MKLPLVGQIGSSSKSGPYKDHPLMQQTKMATSQEAITMLPIVTGKTPVNKLKDFSEPPPIAPNENIPTVTVAGSTDVNSAPVIEQLNDVANLSPLQLQDLIQQAIQYHEKDELKEAFRLYCIVAQQGSVIGLFLSGLALRHGWGCEADQKLAFECLEFAVECAIKNIGTLKRTSTASAAGSKNGSVRGVPSAVGKRLSILSAGSKSGTIPRKTLTTENSESQAENASVEVQSIAPMDSLAFNESIQAHISKFELAMSVYEIGQCYRFGWGVKKSKSTAVFYYRLAADLGDMDAQSDLAMCYMNGKGVKSNRYLAASYFRLAALQGRREYGDGWIYKEKYTLFFRKNFKEFALVEDKKNGKEPLTMSRSMSKLDGTDSPTTGTNGRSLTVLVGIQQFLNNAMQEK